VRIDLDGISSEEAIGWLRQMLVIREFETRCDPLALAGKIMGGVHSSLGQEAVAVGTASALRAGDHSAGTHRSHHHAIAMGIPPSVLMAELFGRATGSNGGRGGSMHVADLTRGFIGGNGIVGAGVGLAMGAALSFKVRGSGQVAVGFVGDGGANTGRTWESVNLATVWRLPLVVICENNLYAVETATATVTASNSIAARAAGFGIRAEAIDGQDIATVHRAVSAALERARAGEGPSFIEARTYRYEGHSTGQNITYRTTDEVSDWRGHRDPIARLRAALTDGGSLDEGAFEDLVAHARSTIDESVAFAEDSPWPEPAAALRGVTALGESVRRLA
jgi:TPP-dependent pyruvate/acetoin dehydrogenase alpha subunit